MTVHSILTDAAQALATRGIEAPRREARLLLAVATDLSASTLMGWPERNIPTDAEIRFRHILARRLTGEPISRIVGRREFWSMDFELGPATLDPRPDSETLITAALDRCTDRQAPLRILDLGTGTGCLLLALLAEFPNATGIGIDRSPDAAKVAKHNADRLGFSARAQFSIAVWATSLQSRFNLIVSNPPYIATSEIGRLESGVQDFDPCFALDGGADGLRAYREIMPEVPRLLAADGLAIFEIGADQAAAVTVIAQHSGLTIKAIEPDLAGHPRAVICTAYASRK